MKLNSDLKNLGSFFIENNLTLSCNIKKVKTELTLSEAISKVSKTDTIDMTMTGQNIFESNRYEHLRITNPLSVEPT